MKISIIKLNKYYLYSILGILLMWMALAKIIDAEIILPSPLQTLSSFIEILRQKYFLIVIISTIKRTLIGFLMALLLGVFLGILGAMFQSIHIILKPLIVFMKSAPTMGLIILALIWLNSESAPIAIGLLVILPIVYGNIFTGMSNIDKKLLEMGRLYKLSKKDMLINIYLPSLKSYIKNAIISGVGLNMKVIIAAEVITQPRYGIGTLFQIERANLNTGGVFAWLFIVVFIVYVFDNIIEYTIKD